MIDNIILIVDASSDGAADMYWPCAFGLSGVTINGKRSGMINLHNSISVFENYIRNNNTLFAQSPEDGVPVVLDTEISGMYLDIRREIEHLVDEFIFKTGVIL